MFLVLVSVLRFVSAVAVLHLGTGKHSSYVARQPGKFASSNELNVADTW